MARKLTYKALEQKVGQMRKKSGMPRGEAETLRRLLIALRNSNDAITLQDFEGNIDVWNRGAERIYGYTEAEALNMKIQQIVPEDKREEYLTVIRSIEEGHNTESFETKRITKDGQILDVWLTVTVLEDDTRRPVALATTERDITGRKRTEEKLRRANEELNDFINVVSHELKTPIIAIGGFTDLLFQQYGVRLDEKGREYLNQVRASAGRMEALVTDLLTLGQIGHVPLTLKQISSDDLIRDVVSNLKAWTQKKNIKVILADGFPSIYCDPERLREVFENLLINAIKYIGDSNAPSIEIGWEDQEGCIQFYLRDNGIGISPEHQTSIFERFRRLADPHDIEGTGLGLAIVKRIIDIHGGKIWVDSEKGKGSTFFFTLPTRNPQ
jgi:PAS domain S-box-containing protein